MYAYLITFYHGVSRRKRQKPYKNSVFLRGFFILLLMQMGHSAYAQTPGVQDIIKQWTAIERRFYETHFHETRFTADGEETETALLDAADAFYNSVREFQQSELFRIYRLVPFSQDSRSAFGPAIQTVADLALAFRGALLEGDGEKALNVSLDISDALVFWLEQDREAGRFYADAHLWLFFVFIGFVVFMSGSFYYLQRALARSLRREAEHSVFSRAFMLAQEEERARISRELHDTIAQDLRYLALGMEKISHTGDAAERERLCREAAALQSTLIRRVRDICDNLVPPDFRIAGLKDAVRRLCLDLGKRSGIDCHAEIKDNVQLGFLGEEKQLQIFRIVQEALVNVEKHAQAKEAIVILRTGPGGELFVGISDDGQGFTPPGEEAGHASTRTLGTLGIRGMKRRAELLGGSLEIKSEAGEGTLVCLRLPAKEGHDENAVAGTADR